MIEDKIKTHRRNLQMISGIDRQLKELQSAISKFYVESEVVKDKRDEMSERLTTLRNSLEDVRLMNYDITKGII
jgi:DNA repair ATPase RecN